MQFKDAESAAAWNTVKAESNDGYSAAAVKYTEGWAALMEAMILEGDRVEECADKASHAADTDGITGFMYGWAAAQLAKFWVHGESLRQWHNVKYGLSANVKGIVNPALVSIAVPEEC